MERYELQKLRDLPIEGVAERLGLRVVRHKTLCPFHNDHHASLSFKVSKNMYRCFVCGASGGPIDLVMRYLNKDFLDACRWLADEHNVILIENGKLKIKNSAAPNGADGFNLQSSIFNLQRYARFFERPWLNDEARRFLFEERRLDARVVSWCRLTSWKDRQGVPWLQTPYYDADGHLIGVQNRNLAYGSGVTVQGSGLNSKATPINREPFTMNHEPRFRFPQGSQCCVYNLPVLNLLKPGDELWITEGCSDCWAMLSAGHKAIAIPSATLLTKEVRSKMEEVRDRLSVSFHMYPDSDEPGERLFLQLQQMLPSLEHHQLPPGCKDFSDYYLSASLKANPGG